MKLDTPFLSIQNHFKRTDSINKRKKLVVLSANSTSYKWPSKGASEALNPALRMILKKCQSVPVSLMCQLQGLLLIVTSMSHWKFMFVYQTSNH